MKEEDALGILIYIIAHQTRYLSLNIDTIFALATELFQFQFSPTKLSSWILILFLTKIVHIIIIRSGSILYLIKSLAIYIWRIRYISVDPFLKNNRIYLANYKKT